MAKIGNGGSVISSKRPIGFSTGNREIKDERSGATPTQRSRRRENFITKAREINFSIGIVRLLARAMPLLTSE